MSIFDNNWRNKMSPNNAVPIEARREDFRKYLDKEGILGSISKALVALYEEPDKPMDALLFVRNNLAGSEMQNMISQLENLTKENEQLKTKVSTLEKNKAALEKAFVDYKVEEEVTDANDEKKDEIQGNLLKGIANFSFVAWSAVQVM